MIKKPDNITVVILSEPEAREISVRYSLRCITRDVRCLLCAMARHRRDFFGVIARGYQRRDHWWTR